MNSRFPCCGRKIQQEIRKEGKEMNVFPNGRLNGRELEFFHHESGAEYGYALPQTDTFAVLHPRDEKAGVNYPLYVVFHSAGHDVYSALACLWTTGNHDIYHAPEDMYALFLDCRANHGDWWWGGFDANGNGDAAHTGTFMQPVEKRCIDTIRRTIKQYPIDENRVYGVGNSMGGSGVLGIALNHGELFAAIIANVPAGVEHAVNRCCLGLPKPEGFKLPDPPVAVDYSAQNDIHSKGHEKLYRGMAADRYALIGYWGPFGHENNNSKIHAVNDLVHCFDALSIRLNEAYPAFTDASTDDAIPWPDNIQSKASGQVNAFFRWKNIEDTPDRFTISLRLMNEDEWKTDITLPQSSTASVTLRRMQRFRLSANEEIRCTYADRTFTARADGNGLLTLHGITVTKDAQELTLTRQI